MNNVIGRLIMEPSFYNTIVPKAIEFGKIPKLNLVDDETDIKNCLVDSMSLEYPKLNLELRELFGATPTDMLVTLITMEYSESGGERFFPGLITIINWVNRQEIVNLKFETIFKTFWDNILSEKKKLSILHHLDIKLDMRCPITIPEYFLIQDTEGWLMVVTKDVAFGVITSYRVKSIVNRKDLEFTPKWLNLPIKKYKIRRDDCTDSEIIICESNMYLMSLTSKVKFKSVSNDEFKAEIPIDPVFTEEPSTDWSKLVEQLHRYNEKNTLGMDYLRIKRAIQTIMKLQPDEEYITKRFEECGVKTLSDAYRVFA